MPKLIFLIGSSGAGKTAVLKSVEAMRLKNLVVCYSDSRPVPSTEDMIAECGSQEEWQRRNTMRWVKSIKESHLTKNDVLFDIQSQPSFIDEACAENGIASYKIVLFDCSDDERKRRLIERKQPELAHDRMTAWAKYLRERCASKNLAIIDNTDSTIQQSLVELLEVMERASEAKRM